MNELFSGFGSVRIAKNCDRGLEKTSVSKDHTEVRIFHLDRLIAAQI